MGEIALTQALRDARARCGLTQEEAARLSKIPRGSLSDVECRGPDGVSLKTLRALAKTYGCTVSELIGEEPQADLTMNSREREAVKLILSAWRGR